MYDTNNYLVTATNIHGPWSEPIALNNFGFAPSLFHDDDGRKYMVSMVTDHRVPKKYVGRLVLQEYDPVKQTMTGPVKDIYRADKIFLEGPHIFKRNGWYYLYLHVSRDEDCGKCITLLKAENKKYEYLTDYLQIYSGLPIYLKAEMQNGCITFSYRVEGSDWQTIAENIDGSFILDSRINMTRLAPLSRELHISQPAC